MKKRKIFKSLRVFLEMMFLWELLMFWKKKKELKKLPVKKISNPIMVLPGFCTNDLFTSPLRKLLNDKGLKCYGWGLGLNKGFHRETLKKLRERIDELYQQHGEPVILIGWSMGGIYARELARRDPKKIKTIITLGSPLDLPLKTPVDILYKRLSGYSIQNLNGLMKKHRKYDYPNSITAISAKKDGIVPYHYCLYPKNHKIKTFVIGNTHIGLPHNGSVIKKILEDISKN